MKHSNLIGHIIYGNWWHSYC